MKQNNIYENDSFCKLWLSVQICSYEWNLLLYSTSITMSLRHKDKFHILFLALPTYITNVMIIISLIWIYIFVLLTFKLFPSWHFDWYSKITSKVSKLASKSLTTLPNYVTPKPVYNKFYQTGFHFYPQFPTFLGFSNLRCQSLSEESWWLLLSL